MADSEVRQKFEAWYLKTPLIDERPKSELQWESWQAGMRAGEIARWIPVTERMPKIGEECLTVQDGYDGCKQLAIPADFVGGGFFTIRGYGYDSEIRELHNVTHWQSLPIGPEKKK